MPFRNSILHHVFVIHFKLWNFLLFFLQQPYRTNQLALPSAKITRNIPIKKLLSFQSTGQKDKDGPTKTAYNIKPLPVSTNMNNNGQATRYRDSWSLFIYTFCLAYPPYKMSLFTHRTLNTSFKWDESIFFAFTFNTD